MLKRHKADMYLRKNAKVFSIQTYDKYFLCMLQFIILVLCCFSNPKYILVSQINPKMSPKLWFRENKSKQDCLLVLVP